MQNGSSDATIDYLEYLETALTLMEDFFYATDKVDWNELRRIVLEGLPPRLTRDDAYGAIDHALSQLGDSHSVFIEPGLRKETGVLQGHILEPTGGRVGRIGYLNLPGDGTPNVSIDEPKLYADVVNELLEDLDSPQPVCGWILDLRENSGGWISPMFASLGPLMGQGLVLSASGPQGTQFIEVSESMEVKYSFESAIDAPSINSPLIDEYTPAGLNNASFQALIEATMTPTESVYQPTLLDPPVAVLISGVTASAAEYVTIAFIGRENTRTFGETTYGIPTTRGSFQFIDGGVLALAIAVPSDRLGHHYSSNLFPDEFIGPSPPGEDRTRDAALAWLRRTAACR